MARHLDDWLQSWLQYSSNLESPERMRLWSGISAISAVLQRKSYTYVRGQFCFPNMYILLVGPPGCGKGNAMKHLNSWLRDMDTVWMTPDGITKRAFYSTLEASPVESIVEGNALSVSDVLSSRHHSLTAFVEELGVFLHPGDNDFIYSLCHVYDTPSQFHYKTEHSGENFVENVYFSMLSAVTPKGLRDIFTEQALELGISARTVIIFSDEKIKVDIFGKPSYLDKLGKELRDDLCWMQKISGEYTFLDETAADLVAWSEEDFAPVPKDTRFEHYNSRRFVQVVKLCMICAAAKRQELIILPEDLFQAKTYLLEAERFMPEAVATIGSNPYVDQQQMAVKLIHAIWDSFKRSTTEEELRSKLSKDVDPRYANMIYDDLCSARWVDFTGKAPERKFFPRGKMKELLDGN